MKRARQLHHYIHSCAWGQSVEILKVSSKSNPNSVAGAMAGVVRQAGAVEVQVVGAGALNQAIKAVAIARGYVAPSGADLTCVPAFADIEIDGQSRTAIRLLVERRPLKSVAGEAATGGDGRAMAMPAVAAPAAAPAPVQPIVAGAAELG